MELCHSARKVFEPVFAQAKPMSRKPAVHTNAEKTIMSTPPRTEA